MRYFDRSVAVSSAYPVLVITNKVCSKPTSFSMPEISRPRVLSSWRYTLSISVFQLMVGCPSSLVAESVMLMMSETSSLPMAADFIACNDKSTTASLLLVLLFEVGEVIDVYALNQAGGVAL